jgi:hypothetical protein
MKPKVTNERARIAIKRIRRWARNLNRFAPKAADPGEYILAAYIVNHCAEIVRQEFK